MTGKGRKVSIHTPIQGVTVQRLASFVASIVSIHTPIQGVTYLVNLCGNFFQVSIHTPIQGVTLNGVTGLYFMMFQSTHPYRVSHCYIFTLSCRIRFNPHTHTGCDQGHSLQADCTKVSIHTPIQGVTLAFRISPAQVRVSIHTPIQGVTFLPPSNRIGVYVSIHTPIQGVTDLRKYGKKFGLVSIHTPIQGVTSSFAIAFSIAKVSIHTPIQGVTLRTKPYIRS